ncbi:MAG: hypothetical protein EPN43_12960 [Jatrophihabitans sp.]|nr:MAG: hypothetical protein EPN43_12960 [Jatrophihabitans sp.]
MERSAGTRRVVFWIVVAATVAAVVVAIGDGLNPDNAEGWVAAPIELAFMALPLALVAVGLHSGNRRVARRTAVAALVLAVAVTFVLVMQLVDPNETLRDRLIQAGALAVYLAAFGVEAPSLRR